MPGIYQNIISYNSDPSIFYIYGVLHCNESLPSRIGEHYNFGIKTHNPSSSIIDADYIVNKSNFKTAEELCDYLLSLDIQTSNIDMFVFNSNTK